MVAGAMRFAGQGASLAAEQADRALSAFADRADIAPYAADAAAFAVSEGIVTGMDQVTFAPKLGATRAQASVMTLRMLQALGFANQ
ncbi:S-layer homology domain-containing protein [Cohnella sp. OV330]|uniref:S-layer homology domain-containing protein n=1 Tax=Cohnella sp. OV330 TaxID=1855288 RepID=UPI0008DF075F|nr:S-layer homology domain-containing protein [Cohnella sp. OV330]SFB59187.1 S-layer homology domain-containing protein [Cohnella sp. OV330]